MPHLDPEQRRKKRREWYARNREKMGKYFKKWMQEHPEEWARNQYRAKLKYKFGITPEQYDKMVKEQDGKCAICGNPPDPNKNLAVDHNHVTKIVRELLCQKCNTGIGLLKENTEIMAKAIEYLKLRNIR